MVSTVMRYARPDAVAAQPLVIVDIDIKVRAVVRSIKITHHALDRLNHGKVAPAALYAPYAALICEIVRCVAVFSCPHRSRRVVLLLTKTVPFVPCAKHVGIVVAVGYIGGSVV